MTRIRWILTWALKSLKNLHFEWFLLCKVFNVWIKKVRKSYLSWHWRVTQIWRKTDLWFGKWHDGFGKFSPEHSKVSELGLWWDPFVQSRKCTSLKFTEELCVMTIKNDTKTEKESTCHFTIDMRNLINFYPIARKSNICTLNWLLLTNVYNVWAKNVQKSTEVLCLMALKIDANFEGILTCAFKNDMRFLANLHRLK